MNDDKENLNGVKDRGDAGNRVLGAIRDRNLSMRPRWYFVLRGILAAIGCLISLLAGLYIASLVVFLMRRTGAWFVPVFGAHGWIALMLSLPWILLVFLGIFVVVLELLVRRYAFAYRRPLMMSAGGILLLVIFGGIVVGMTSLHGRLERLTSEHQVPFIAGMYRAFEGWHRDDVHQGMMAQEMPDGFIFNEYDGDTLHVIVGSNTRFEGGVPGVGDTVVVFGKEDDGSIGAEGVRVLDPSDVE